LLHLRGLHLLLNGLNLSVPVVDEKPDDLRVVPQPKPPFYGLEPSSDLTVKLNPEDYVVILKHFILVYWAASAHIKVGVTYVQNDHKAFNRGWTKKYMMSADERSLITLRVNLKGSVLERFLILKEKYGIENDTELVRLLISNEHERDEQMRREAQELEITALERRLKQLEELTELLKRELGTKC